MNTPVLFIRIRQLRDACWQSHIRKDKAKSLELAAMIEETARQLKESLSEVRHEDND